MKYTLILKNQETNKEVSRDLDDLVMYSMKIDKDGSKQVALGLLVDMEKALNNKQ